MFITITNYNPQFSYLISKNPASPPKISRERKGLVCGWYGANDVYCLNFIDAADEVSYPDYHKQDFEYLSRGAYCSPFLAYKMLKEEMKLEEEHDGEFYNAVDIYSLNIKDSTIDLFKKYFDYNWMIESCGNWPKYKTVTISTKGKFSDFIEFIKLFLFYASIDNEKHFIDDGLIIEQCKRLERIDAPYFVRYLFKQNLCKNSKKRFDEVKEYLCDDRYELCPYNNFESRMRFVQDNVYGAHIYDVGCGEGRYIKRLYRNNKSYTGVDIDDEQLSLAQKRADKLELDCDFFASIDDIQDDREKTVICSEVIEHMPCEDIPGFFQKIKQLGNVEKIIITTPNITFNKNYAIDGLRHEDHDCELTQDEFTNLLAMCFPDSIIEIYNVGDIVNGEPTTFGAVINEI